VATGGGGAGVGEVVLGHPQLGRYRRRLREKSAKV